jgi:hypothetical protein
MLSPYLGHENHSGDAREVHEMNQVLRPRLRLKMLMGVDEWPIVTWSLWRSGRGSARKEEEAERPNGGQETCHAPPLLAQANHRFGYLRRGTSDLTRCLAY